MQTTQRTGQIRLVDGNGKAYQWSFGKDGKSWFLIDHTGYRRTLEDTWQASVPRIRAIADNHGLFAVVS